jgi:cobalt-zinc-cadmium efflux system outer membrane protein
LREQILPAAEESFEAVNLGYRSGKFGFLEVLDTQRTLFEVRGQYVEALAAYHRAKAEVERVIGSPVPGATFSTEPNDDRGE